MGDLPLENWETSLRKICWRPLHWKNGGRHCVRPPPSRKYRKPPLCTWKCTRFCSKPPDKVLQPNFSEKVKYRYFFNMIFDISWNIIDGSFFNSFDCNQIKLNQIIYLAIKYMYRWIFIINISWNYSLWQGDGTTRNLFQSVSRTISL